MLFVHEIHRVMGLHEDEFEQAYREVLDARARARPTTRACSTSPATRTAPGAAYNTITLTAVTDGAAWERLATRLRTGDLRTGLREVDTMRHDVTSKVLVPVEWSPLQDVDLANVPIGGDEHDPTLFMEDTAWPHAGQAWRSTSRRPATTTRRASPRAATAAGRCSSSRPCSPRRGARAPGGAR